MENLEIKVPLIDGTLKTLEFKSGSELISNLCSTSIDFRKIVAFYIKATSKDGRQNVTIYVENSNKEDALVLVTKKE